MINTEYINIIYKHIYNNKKFNKFSKNQHLITEGHTTGDKEREKNHFGMWRTGYVIMQIQYFNAT